MKRTSCFFLPFSPFFLKHLHVSSGIADAARTRAAILESDITPPGIPPLKALGLSTFFNAFITLSRIIESPASAGLVLLIGDAPPCVDEAG